MFKHVELEEHRGVAELETNEEKLASNVNTFVRELCVLVPKGDTLSQILVHNAASDGVATSETNPSLPVVAVGHTKSAARECVHGEAVKAQTEHLLALGCKKVGQP